MAISNIDLMDLPFFQDLPFWVKFVALLDQHIVADKAYLDNLLCINPLWVILYLYFLRIMSGHHGIKNIPEWTDSWSSVWLQKILSPTMQQELDMWFHCPPPQVPDFLGVSWGPPNSRMLEVHDVLY